MRKKKCVQRQTQSNYSNYRNVFQVFKSTHTHYLEQNVILEYLFKFSDVFSRTLFRPIRLLEIIFLNYFMFEGTKKKKKFQNTYWSSLVAPISMTNTT